MALKNLRWAAIVGIAAFTSATLVNAQQNPVDQAADAAQQVADEADTAIRAIDPTTGGASLVIDPSLPQPFDMVAEEVGDLRMPALGDAVTVGVEEVEATRGPAARMISQPQVQDLPVADPVIAPAISPAQVASNDPFRIKSILPIEGTIRYGEWYWDESRAPANGPLVITVDLEARVISVFRDGHEIGTAVALLGTPEHPTPLGTFPILTKERDNVSEKYNNAPMPWTLRLTWDGVAIHGSPVINGYASHGCVGVPDPFAEKLFAVARRGDKVVITRGQMIGVGDKLLASN